MSDIQIPDLDRLIRFRRELHKHPEVSNREEKTAERVMEFLKETNPDEILTDLGGHGVAALYEGKESGPTVMFRCELDALPIREDNEFDYRSDQKRVGHMCGHDGHMAIIGGLATLMAVERPLKGRVVLLYQPAEETGEGAERVLDDKRFSSIEPQAAFALHNLPGFPEGTILIRDGVFASASCGMIVSLKGMTSHAGHPADGRNPAMAASQILQSLVALPQMHTSLHSGALITPIHLRVGRRAFGTSAGDGEVMVTLRAHDAEDMETMKREAVRLAEGIGSAYHLDVTTEWTEEFHAVHNNDECAARVRDAAADLNLSVREMSHPFPWSEDFGRFTATYDGALFGLGSGTDHAQLHNNDYDFPESILETGIRMFYRILQRTLGAD